MTSSVASNNLGGPINLLNEEKNVHPPLVSNLLVQSPLIQGEEGITKAINDRLIRASAQNPITF